MGVFFGIYSGIHVCSGFAIAMLHTMLYTVYSRYIAVVCIAELDISRSHVGPKFFDAQERDIFREIAVTPWTQFAGDNFSRSMLTAIAFVPGSPKTIFREINSGLPVNAGWNTCCAMVSQARLSIDTSIVSQSRVWLIQWQCKSRMQSANLGINNALLIKSSLVDHAVYIRHLVQTQTVPQQIKSVWLVDIPEFL